MVTLAVLRNNRTMEAISNSNNNNNNNNEALEERPSKRQCLRRVRFSDSAPQTFTFNNFEAMTDLEVEQVRERVWYTVRLERFKLCLLTLSVSCAASHSLF